MQVRNINGTSDNDCRCESWLKHWERFSGSTASYCCVEGCINNARVGAHVQVGGLLSQTWYIVPMCSAHNNQRGGHLEISDYTPLVPANVKETCGA
ncbi:hypothetical protein [Sansalvadorimonas verongulae]|uniref:hypothetical protein n=1 Tax=Sansalvadorimonas verongulae TaxID=2172824 RepID=UPI0012BCEDB1|nr:hypothetical protein [Sansalvadorimonas verongulae]MTI13356.1 hypothetical protein [Sansalvadorimonas verongulae]